MRPWAREGRGEESHRRINAGPWTPSTATRTCGQVPIRGSLVRHFDFSAFWPSRLASVSRTAGAFQVGVQPTEGVEELLTAPFVDAPTLPRAGFDAVPLIPFGILEHEKPVRGAHRVQWNTPSVDSFASAEPTTYRKDSRRAVPFASPRIGRTVAEPTFTEPPGPRGRGEGGNPRDGRAIRRIVSTCDAPRPKIPLPG